MKKSIVLVLLVFVMSCSVKTPDIEITGEKTVLERQVLGTYKDIESEAYVIASTRAFDTEKTATMSSQKQEVLEAVQNRKFNKDDVNEFKRDHVIGENNRGFLQVLPNEKYNRDEQYRQLVDQIVEEENHDREVIYERVVAINQEATSAEGEEINEIFAKLQYDNSESGTMIQNTAGEWVKKP